MKRHRIFIICVGLLASGLYFLWPTLFSNLVLEGLRTAQRDGVRISWSGLKAKGLTVTFEAISGWLAGPSINGGIRVPLRIEFGSSEVRLSLSSLFTLNPSIEFNLKAYGGVIVGRSSKLLSEPITSLKVNDVDLGQHPQLRALGLTSAVLSGTISDLQYERGGVKGLFDLMLQRIDAPDISGAIPIVKLEPLINGEMHTQAKLEPGAVAVRDLAISSPYGSVNGSFQASEISGNGAPSAQGDFRIALSPSFQQQVGPFLPLLSGDLLSPSTQRFSAQMAGSPCPLQGASRGEVKLGQLCLRFTPRAM